MKSKTFYFRGDKAKYLGTSGVGYKTVWFDAEYLEGHRKGDHFSTPVPPDGTTAEEFAAIYAAHGLGSIPSDVFAYIPVLA